jgi:mono/diheme cytochrome c family protein
MRKQIIAFIIGLLILPAAVLILALLGLLPFYATAIPSKLETNIAVKSLHASIKGKTSEIKNPLVASEEVLLSGLKMYRSNCAGCHGDYQQPSPWGTKNFYPRVPQFGMQASNLTSEEMFVVVKNGVRYSGMASWNGLISNTEIWRIVTFLSHINSLPTNVDQAWKKKQQS